MITLVSSANAQLKASYFDPTSMGAPTAGDRLPARGNRNCKLTDLTRGAAAQITITPPRGENFDQLLDDSERWLDRSSQSDGLEFRDDSGGSLIVNLADGDIGEFNPAFDGTIIAYLVPVYRQLSASIGNAPSQLTAGQWVDARQRPGRNARALGDEHLASHSQWQRRTNRNGREFQFRSATAGRV